MWRVVYVQAHILVSGMVQGVGYRYFAVRAAKNLGLTGWVKNLRSGEVEVLAEGQRGLVESLIQDLWTGNPYASVRNVQVDWRPYSAQFKGFEVAY